MSVPFLASGVRQVSRPGVNVAVNCTVGSRVLLATQNRGFVSQDGVECPCQDRGGAAFGQPAPMLVDMI